MVCKVFMFLPKLIIMGALGTMVAIAADRYRVMVIQRILYRSEAIKAVGVIWLIATILSGPQLYEYNVYEELDRINSTITTCGSEGIIEHFETGYAAALLVVYGTALVVLLFSYTKILRLVWDHAKRFRSNQTEQPNVLPDTRLEQTISAKKIRVLKNLGSVTVAFVILWTPYFTLFAIKVNTVDVNIRAHTWATTLENIPSDMWAQWRFRSACPVAKSG